VIDINASFAPITYLYTFDCANLFSSGVTKRKIPCPGDTGSRINRGILFHMLAYNVLTEKAQEVAAEFIHIWISNSDGTY
jgi:hypothetical protein